jgi:SAM-dependent methyltransferase
MQLAPEKRPFVQDFRRSVQLFQAFRSQYSDPDGFYTLLAEDTVHLVKRYLPLLDEKVVDIGGGRGYFADAFRRAGARSVLVEPFWDELSDAGCKLGYGIIGDGMRLPLGDGSFAVSHSSNVLEHVVQPQIFVDEMVRVVKPGGIVFLSFTNWLSPFGGHETSPWHYLGGERAAHHYERKKGHPPKNRFGSSLFRLNISEVLSWLHKREDTAFIEAFPRYYPNWTKPLVTVPGVREFATWNVVIVMRRL